MSFAFYTVAQAIAVRFGPTVVSAPSGEDNIAQSTAALPDVISDEPTVLVFPPEVQFGYGPSLRKAVATYPVRFYLWNVRDKPRNAALVMNWISALYASIDGQAHLGLSSYVNTATLGTVTPGTLTYGGTEFYGLELSVEVTLSEGLSATGGA